MAHHWVLYFGRDRTRERYERALRDGFAAVGQAAHASLRELRAGDEILFYAALSGFVARATADAAVRRSGAPGVRFAGAEGFPEPARYRFPDEGPHPELGIGHEDLPRELLPIHEDAYLRVLARARGHAPPEAPPGAPTRAGTPKTAPKRIPKTVTPNGTPNDAPTTKRPAEPPNRTPDLPPPGSTARATNAGGHAMREYEKRAGRWGRGKAVAETFGLGFVARHADAKIRDAERTWGAGARAEAAVGDELERLRWAGFEVFHDVPARGIGNIDHVAVGPQGIFAVETKSHGGRVEAIPDGRRLLLLRGRKGEPPRVVPQGFAEQARREAEALSELLAERGFFSRRYPEVFPVLCFTRAWVERRGLRVAGVAVTKASWLAEELADGPRRLSQGDVQHHARRLSKLAW